MPELWSLLALAAAVAAGLVTAIISAVLVHSRPTAFFRFFLIQILLFDLLILAGLVFRFVELHFWPPGMRPHPWILPAILAVLGALKLGWLYPFIGMTLVLPGQEIPASFRGRFTFITAAFFGAWVTLLAGGVVTGSNGLVGFLIALMELGVLGGAAAACLLLLIRAASLPSGPRRLSITILGVLFLGFFAVMTGSLVLGWLLLSGQTPTQVLFNSIFLLLYNLLPLAWIHRFQPIGPLRAEDALDRYGITPREREIIDQICTGCTNQEIADRLFISLATVKDHNYNIFRKTGVRNRVELTNLMKSAGPD